MGFKSDYNIFTSSKFAHIYLFAIDLSHIIILILNPILKFIAGFYKVFYSFGIWEII